MGLNELFLQRAGLERQNRINQEKDTGINIGNLLSTAAASVIPELLKQKEENNRINRVKDNITNFQKMMQTMQSMPDNSSSAKAIETINDDTKKRQKGVIGVSDYVPEQSITTDENGSINLKFGYRKATPQEQKAQFEIKKAQSEMARSQAKTELLDAYVKGQVQEGSILSEMATLGITAEEFDIASQARTRMRSIPQVIPQGFEPTEITRDRMGNLIPSNIKKVGPSIDVTKPALQEQPTTQEQVSPFRFKTDKTVAEQKFEAEKAETERKAQLEGDMVKESAQDTLNTIKEIEDGIRYFGAAGNIPAFPAEYDKQNWQANLEKLQSKLVVDLINKMKQASRTGATGFGALSEKELKVLQSAATALRKGMSESDAKKYINEIKNSAKKVLGENKDTDSVNSAPLIRRTLQTSKGTQYRIISE